MLKKQPFFVKVNSIIEFFIIKNSSIPFDDSIK